jgi:hypothetical protein
VTDYRELYDHIHKVQTNLNALRNEMYAAGLMHDWSKAEPEEEALFLPDEDRHPYGTEDYEDVRLRLGDAIKHHYEHARHHPEHFKDGIRGMTLVDVCEMFCDWLAATKRCEKDNIHASIDYNKKRFKMSDELVSILHNTAREVFGEE